MGKFKCLLFVLKRSSICYYMICMTVPLSSLELNQRFRTLGNYWYYQITKLIWYNAIKLKVQLCKLRKTLINDRLSVWNVSWNFTFQLFIFLAINLWNLLFFQKANYFFNTIYCLFCLYANSSRLNNLKTKKVMNTKLSGFVTYVKIMIFLLLYNLRECTFKSGSHHFFPSKQK